jgi:hypothetical protein
MRFFENVKNMKKHHSFEEVLKKKRYGEWNVFIK